MRVVASQTAVFCNGVNDSRQRNNRNGNRRRSLTPNHNVMRRVTFSSVDIPNKLRVATMSRNQ